MLRLARVHAPHPHVPHPHVDPHIQEHPWRAVPFALGVVVLLIVLLIVASFAIAKAYTGHAY
ncbi:MAG TPA: hypothetical protein VFJ77_03795 [Gaiellaceae bacterium]|nr:hypothetical protein [Gaiellaceae bacterium]